MSSVAESICYQPSPYSWIMSSVRLKIGICGENIIDLRRVVGFQLISC